MFRFLSFAAVLAVATVASAGSVVREGTVLHYQIYTDDAGVDKLQVTHGQGDYSLPEQETYEITIDGSSKVDYIMAVLMRTNITGDMSVNRIAVVHEEGTQQLIGLRVAESLLH